MNRRRFFRRVATALGALPFVGRIVGKKPTVIPRLPAGTLWGYPVVVSYTAEDRDYMERVQFSKEEICRMFKVSPHVVMAIRETSRIAEAASARARERLLDQLTSFGKRR